MDQSNHGKHAHVGERETEEAAGTPTPDACNRRRRRAGIINGMMASVEWTK